jgi:hypothetical protein
MTSIINACMLHLKAKQVFIFQSSLLFPFRHILSITQGKNGDKFIILLFFISIFNIHKRGNWLNKIISLDYCLQVSICWIKFNYQSLHSPSYFLAITLKKKKEEKLLTSYDFISSARIDWNKTIISLICISFNWLYCVYIYIYIYECVYENRRIKRQAKKNEKDKKKEFIQICSG